MSSKLPHCWLAKRCWTSVKTAALLGAAVTATQREAPLPPCLHNQSLPVKGISGADVRVRWPPVSKSPPVVLLRSLQAALQWWTLTSVCSRDTFGCGAADWRSSDPSSPRWTPLNLSHLSFLHYELINRRLLIRGGFDQDYWSKRKGITLFSYSDLSAPPFARLNSLRFSMF